MLLAHLKKVKVTHSRLSSVGFRGWSRLLQSACRWRESYTRSIGCHYFPPGTQLLSQPLRGLVPALLLGKHRHNKREQFAQDCYPTASRLRFEPMPFCAWVQHANHSAAQAHLAFKILHVDNHRVSSEWDALAVTNPFRHRETKACRKKNYNKWHNKFIFLKLQSAFW